MEKFEGYKTIVFFGVALLVALANLVGFGDFSLSPDQLEVFNFVVLAGGFVLRLITKGKVFNS
jgi:hypothetical protein